MLKREAITRRDFVKQAGMAVSASMLAGCLGGAGNGGTAKKGGRPNIILCMCDDLGWGDVGYHGVNPLIKTPHLDEMASQSLQFRRFYAGAPVCSPTRGSVITGRHPYRYGIYFANVGHMKPEELTLGEVFQELGYRTGHFGKWHLGTLTREVRDSNRGGKGDEHYSPPWENGFEVCYSTEAKVPTWNPMYEPGTNKLYGTRYWREDGNFVDPESEALKGDDSRIIMDQALTFIKQAASAAEPFLAVVWFHTPHLPTVAGPQYQELYKDLDKKRQHYYGCISAMDEQMGRLRATLRKLGVAENTLLWFTSDNGPEVKTPGSTGGFRDRKRSLHEGGVRVPGLLEWPARIRRMRITEVPCVTCDYFPTLMEVVGYEPKWVRPVDGISLMGLIDGTMTERPTPIGFESKEQRALSGNRYKLYSKNNGTTYELYDLIEDPFETRDVAGEHPETVAAMKAELERWITSCKKSDAGGDY